MSIRGGAEGMYTAILIVPPPYPLWTATGTPAWSQEPCRIFLSNWNLSWATPGSGICSSNSTSCWWLSTSWKNTQKWKCPQSSSQSPVESQAVQVKMAVPKRPRKTRKSWNMWSYIRGNTSSSHPRMCPLWGAAAGETRSSPVFILTQGIEPGGTTSSPIFVLTQGIKPARSAWGISVWSSTSELALSCCFLGQSKLLKSKQCTRSATAVRTKCNSQGNISQSSSAAPGCCSCYHSQPAPCNFRYSFSCPWLQQLSCRSGSSPNLCLWHSLWIRRMCFTLSVRDESEIR